MSLLQVIRPMLLQQIQSLNEMSSSFNAKTYRTYDKKNDGDFSPSPVCANMVNKCKPSVKKTKTDDFQFHHLIKYSPECCKSLCPDNLQRFDDCYYKTSDKAKRKYQQTWVECPPLKIKPKKICCFEKGIKPNIPRRKRKVCKETDHRVCDKGAASACPKINLPGCRPVAKSLKCSKSRFTSCQRVKAPYPAYSECKHLKMKPKYARECECLDVPALCDVWSLMRKRERNKPKYVQCKRLK